MIISLFWMLIPKMHCLNVHLSVYRIHFFLISFSACCQSWSNLRYITGQIKSCWDHFILWGPLSCDTLISKKRERRIYLIFPLVLIWHMGSATWNHSHSTMRLLLDLICLTYPFFMYESACVCICVCLFYWTVSITHNQALRGPRLY